jgi:ureidoglycolate dehydrogenase (NAD+)
LLIDVVCSLLSDSPYGPDIPKMYGDMTQPRRLGGLVGAIDIGRFVPLERFCARASELIRRWCALPPTQPGGKVLFPGQPELLMREKRLREGIPMGVRLFEEFDRLAAAYRVTCLRT